MQAAVGPDERVTSYPAALGPADRFVEQTLKSTVRDRQIMSAISDVRQVRVIGPRKR
jgi:hypothetical protein